MPKDSSDKYYQNTEEMLEFFLKINNEEYIKAKY